MLNFVYLHPHQKRLKMKELKKEIREILFKLDSNGFYPIIIYRCVNGDIDKNTRFYLNDKDKVGKEVFYNNIEEKNHRKKLFEEEIEWIKNNISSYEKKIRNI